MMGIPHFDIPFRINAERGAAVVEQDSEKEILNCVETILRYQKGQRPESPEFGIPDLTFAHPTTPVQPIQDAVIEWEPRIETRVDEPIIENLIHTIVTGVNVERR